MKTQILIISNKEDITTDFIVRKLLSHNVLFYRLNTEDIEHSVFVSLDFENQVFTLFDSKLDKHFNLQDFKSVYFRRPELPLYKDDNLSAKERRYMQTEAAYTLEGIYSILESAYWISPVWAIRKAENKLYQIQLARKLGFHVPASIATNLPESFKVFRSKHNECIIKPVRSGHIQDDTNPEVVYTNLLMTTPPDEQIKVCPNYLQEHIEKKYDVRVTVVGDKTYAVRIDSQSTEATKVDWRRGENILPHQVIELPTCVQNQSVAITNALGLQFGAIDYVIDRNGNFVFLELNPNGQWAWIENITGLDISGAISDLLIKNI